MSGDGDETVLVKLKIARDTLIARIAAGQDVTRYNVGSRSVSRDGVGAVLKEIERLIAMYERKVDEASASSGNVAYARFENEPQ